MPTEKVVYISNMSPAHSYESASRYGAIRPVTSGNYPVHKTERLLEEIIQALVQSEEDDYLLLSGSSFIAALCLAVWFMLHKRCLALLWVPRQQEYILRTLKREDILTQIVKMQDKVKKNGRG